MNTTKTKPKNAQGLARGTALGTAANQPNTPPGFRPWNILRRGAVQLRMGCLILSLFALAAANAFAGYLNVAITPVPIQSHFDLTALGTEDWAHWGTGGIFPGFDHKATGGGKISNVSEVETNVVDSGKAAAGTASPSRYSTWTDGDPTVSAFDEPGFIYADGPSARQGMGYSFTVPADTATRTLYVLAGGFNTIPRLTASLSDGSAVSITNTTSSGSTTNYQRIYAISYKADSAGQTLTVSYVRTTGNNVSVDLVAAWLVPGAHPTVSMLTPTNGAVLSKDLFGPSNIELTAAAADVDGTVTNVDYYANGVLVGSATTSPFSVIWTNAALGANALVAIATDNSGMTGFSTTNNVVVNKIITGGGVLQMASKTDVANGTSLDLTALGTSDWAHWGAQGIWGAYDHKATGGGQISDLTEIETVAADSGKAFADSVNKIRKANWTDGTPTASAVDEPGYVFAQAAPNGARQLTYGYSFTVPADTTERTVSILLGGFGATARVEASLSDPSAADIFDQSAPGSTAQWQRIYSIKYKAASAGQTLTVRILHAAGNFSLDLKEAWLVVGTPPTVSVTSPTNSETILTALGAPSSIPITATAVDAETSVTKVDFYVDGVFYETDTTSPYSVVWTNATIGSHVLTAVASDTDNNLSTSTPITVNVQKIITGGGELAMSYASVAYGSHWDLSVLGTSDWAHWGTFGLWPSFDHSDSGGSQISDVTVIAPLEGDSGKAKYNLLDPGQFASWTNGTPNSIITDDIGYIYGQQNISRQGMGYSFTAPADTTLRTLYVLAGGLGTTTQVKVSLSDPSAADVVKVLPPVTTTNYARVFMIKYKAASAAQTMTFSVIRVDGGSDVYLKAAWLVVGEPAAPQLNPIILNGSDVELNWSGFGELQRAPAVEGPWTTILPTPPTPYLEPIVPGENRFYRLKVNQ